MWVKHLSSLQFLTYVAFFAVVIAAICKFVPGRAPPVRDEPYPDEELHAHDAKTAKYFIAGSLFLVLGSLHMVLKNLPWLAEYLARTGYAGHLVRDLSNTHVMIVGGGTLLATGLCWLALPRIVRRPLASEGLAQCAFWFTVIGLAVFYVSLIGNGLAMGPLIEHGWTYPAAKAHMGQWYRAPTGMGAGVMGLGYWCFATNVLVTIFQSRLVHVAKPQWHLWKFFATGAAALTVGTVQGVIQVQPANADWLYKAGHAGEWIDPISHAHINLVTGLAMLVAGSLFAFVRRLGGVEPSRRLVNTCFFALLGGSLAFYFSALYLGFHEGALVVHRGLSPEAAEEATALHPYLIMGSGIAMFGAFWLLLAVAVRCVWRAQSRLRPFVLAGCAALAVGTLQGPVQAVPLVNEAARPRRRGGRRDREPARPAEHARGPDAAADRDRARLARAARRLVARAAGPTGARARPGRDGRVLRGGRRVLGRRGASGRRRALVRGSGLGEPAVGGTPPRAGSARRARRLQRLRLRGLADDLPPAGGRASDSRGGSARLHGQDPGARGSPQPGRPRRLRAAARADGLPGSGVAVRRLPVHGLDPAARGPGAHVGGDPGRVQPLRPRAAEGAGLGRRARLAAADGAHLLGRALPGTRAAAREARGPPAPRPHAAGAQPGELPDSRERRGRDDHAPARRHPLRPRGRGRRREHRPLLVRAAADEGRHGPVHHHEGRSGEALQLERSADVVPARRAPAARVAAPSRCSCAPPRSTHRTRTSSTTSRGSSRSRSSSAARLRASFRSRPQSRSSRAATRSWRPTRGCSAGATSPTCRWSRRARR